MLTSFCFWTNAIFFKCATIIKFWSVSYVIIPKTQAKLNAGVRLKDHMISYGDRLNDYDSVSKCKQMPLLLPYLTLLWQQISGINLVPSISLTHPTENVNCLVSVMILSLEPCILLIQLVVHLTSVTDTRRTFTIISNGRSLLCLPNILI